MAKKPSSYSTGANKSDTKDDAKDDASGVPNPKEADFIATATDRFGDASEFESEQRDKAVSDYKFALLPGHQWDTHLTAKRRRRPCYEFNRTRQMIRRVTGEQLQNRPQIKVRPAEDGDKDTAEIYQGLIRNIEVTSHAKLAYDNGFTWACAGGVGAWEVSMEYGAGESDPFNKCLKIKPIDDPFSVAFDPAAKDFFRRDARYAFKTTMIPRATFKKLYPGKKIVDFEANQLTRTDQKWWYQNEVRIAKYYYKEPVKRVVYRLSDGTVVDAVEFDPIALEAAQPSEQFPEGLTIAETREIDSEVIKCCLISGAERLSEVTEWPGKYIPIVLNWGELLTVEGRQFYLSMTRFGRDAQMVHNFELSTLIEVVAKMPNSPLTATPKMIEGLQSYYERLGYDDPPVLLYNADPNAPGGRPQREQAATFPAAFANVSAIATEELKANMGVYDASLGNKSNETSGRAILARQQEGNVSNYVYIDNHMKALTYTGEMLVDLIPKVYDATRTLRILGEDGAEKFVRVNKQIMDFETGQPVTINDLSKGSYDVVVSTGKSFETQRMEVAETAQAMVGAPGPFGMLAQYLLIKNLDVPGMDEFAKACRKVLVSQGLLEPGDGDEPPKPQAPNPKEMADAMLKAAQAGKAKAETDQIIAETPGQVEKTRAETAQSVLKVAQALPTVPIGPSVYGPAPGAQQPSPIVQ